MLTYFFIQMDIISQKSCLKVNSKLYDKVNLHLGGV